jgi:hypothetical protein
MERNLEKDDFERLELKLKDIKERDVAKHRPRMLQCCALISPGFKRVDLSTMKVCNSYITLLRPLLM